MDCRRISTRIGGRPRKISLGGGADAPLGTLFDQLKELERLVAERSKSWEQALDNALDRLFRIQKVIAALAAAHPCIPKQSELKSMPIPEPRSSGERQSNRHGDQSRTAAASLQDTLGVDGCETGPESIPTDPLDDLLALAAGDLNQLRQLTADTRRRLIRLTNSTPTPPPEPTELSHSASADCVSNRSLLALIVSEQVSNLILAFELTNRSVAMGAGPSRRQLMRLRAVKRIVQGHKQLVDALRPAPNART